VNRLSVVVAAYDEQENIEALTRRLESTLSALAGWHWELIFVIEGADGTHAILERLGREIPALRILYQETPSGLGNAFRRGFAAVPLECDAVITMDADLNHQPEEIPRLLAAWRARNADILIGSRFVDGSQVDGTPWWRRFLSGAMNSAMGSFYGVAARDKTSGYRIYRRSALHAVRFVNNDFAFLPEILIRAHHLGLRVVEEPMRFIYRREGRSKMAFGKTCLSYLRLLRTGAGGHDPSGGPGS
jgi:dolichol-phosphate mannosyltransferase